MTDDAIATTGASDHAADEQDVTGLNNRLNWLRAGVLGANDGIVSVAGMVMGVAGATSDRGDILVAGVAGLVAGAISMGAGEYVSVSTQSDAESALLAKEARELKEMPEEELDELTDIIQSRGIERALARKVALQLTERNALRAHAVLELGIDPDDTVHPWHAAIASTVSFTIGAILPLLTIMLPSAVRVGVTVGAVAVALAITGVVSARLGYASPKRALIRNVLGGLVAMAVTFGIGSALGTQIS
jgi:VIT1/CCC1 family predicted Fe2+/Mn2+ transporter